MSDRKASFMDKAEKIDQVGSAKDMGDSEEETEVDEEADTVDAKEGTDSTNDEEEETVEYVKLKNVQTNPRTMISVSLARPVLEEGETVQYEEREPEDAPVNIYPGNNGDTTEYRTRRGQRKMEDLGRTIRLMARGNEGDTVEVKRDVLRAPDVQSKIDSGSLRVIDK